MLAYKLRLYPTREQERKLLWTKEVCRRVYNQFLELYNAGEHSYKTLRALLPLWKKEDNDLKNVNAQVLQYVLYRLFLNLRSLRALKERGRKVGRPRYKSKRHFKTFTYIQAGFKLIPKNDKYCMLHLSKIGDIPIRLHREVEGKIKGITIKQMPSGKWYAYLLVENGGPSSELNIINCAIGLDVGLTHYVVDSDGEETENPRFLQKTLKKLRKEQKRLSKKEKESKNCGKQRIIVARTYKRVQNQRNDFQHKLSRHYVDGYDLIVTEKLRPGNMVQNRNLSRHISDASWSSLNAKLSYKAENAGKLFVQVEARGTSQDCSRCGELVKKNLSDRWHECPHCGLSLSRDHNASINVLNRGVKKVRSERPELTLVDIRPLQSPASALQVEWVKQETPPI